ncbi:chymotrypsin-like elastase family member 2A [Oppia nitens]|uniref:chymotrypsin-like elastase family member 2A n=1 Tax=Oppia nitens TaxID=1686743 RepID=UPI0023D9C943|nr:chymotrypsin-like elastase family member 2A [Oppia nitens]
MGGLTVRPLEFPWMGSLQVKYFSSHNCGATLINDEWALTAAHCMRKSIFPFTWKIRFGGHMLNKYGEMDREFAISKVFIHKDYSNITKVNDITLLKLSTKVDFSNKDKHLKPICLPHKNLQIPDGAVCLAVGWGKRYKNESMSPVLMKVSKQMVDRNTCIKSWPGISFPITDGHLCFDGMTDESGVCNGDSGGPIQCQTSDGKWIQLGVASWTSNPCALKGYPAVFTKLSHYFDWIQDIISKN